MEMLVLLVALIAGLAVRKLGYPPMLGYLAAGFIAFAMGMGDIEVIRTVADIGILLLLFTIGLKLNLKRLAAPHILGVAMLHMGIVVPLTAAVVLLSAALIPALVLDDVRDGWVLAFALSFSSTVFALKIFQERGEENALHTDVAIGILIIQDLMAVAFLVLTADKMPSLWAFLLLALPLARPLLLRLLQAVGHGELLLLLGFTLALCGAELFEAVHLKGSLGALVLGVLVSNSAKTDELYHNLMGFKDLFLIGFFLQIGFYGLPSATMLLAALGLTALIFLRPIIYFLLLVAFRLRARTALLAGVSLFNYSEFGLIVAAIAVAHGMLPPEWLTTLALALALSFLIATVFNTRVHALYARFAEQLQRFERRRKIAEETLPDLGDAEVIILGMGRVGIGAYRELQKRYGEKIVGVEANYDEARRLNARGIPCIHGDAMDRDFWERVAMHKRQLILVSLTSFRENMAVVKLARQLNFANTLAVTCRYPDELRTLEDAGCIGFYLYRDVGKSFAEYVQSQLEPATAGSSAN